jgi:transglutaminase/protease-like cytokinesis protein 3
MMIGWLMPSQAPTWPPKSSSATMGAKIGSTISVISIQSKKKPSRKIIPISTNRIDHGPTPVSRMKSTIIRSPPMVLNTKAKAVAPTKMPNSIPPVSAERLQTSRKFAQVSCRLNAASRIEPEGAHARASVGVAKPAKIDPSTITIRKIGGRKLRKTIAQNSPRVSGAHVVIHRRRKLRANRHRISR